MICGSAGSKSGLGKAAGAEVAVSRRNEKLHAAKARSSFSSYNVQNTSGADRFLKFWCPKMARRCGVKHICKSNAKKTDAFGSLLEVWMSENGTPLCREAHLQVKMRKTPQRRSILHAAVARNTFASQNAKNMRSSGHFLKCGCRKIVEKMPRHCGVKHIDNPKCQHTLRFTPLLEVSMS